ncbi:MAG: AAA family ATPase, partial [Clostridia bacterium]|nr:AAA family ATPase [Clostridia bacterium]
MKPIKLEIEGLNSFESRQILDFTKLGTGVFGIFGKTGSGKSTILDAIILALYGDVERSKQNIEFINTKRKKAVVSLEFEIFVDGAVKKYLVTRSFQIRKNGKDVESNAQIYEIESNNKTLITEGTNKTNEKIYEIIRLGKNEFIKCIALPQGEFSAFLKANQSERTEIMSKIFDLSKYGTALCMKVKEKVNEYDREIAGLSSSLSLVEYANDDVLENIRKDFYNNSQNYSSKNIELKEKSEKFTKLSKLLDDKNKLESLITQFDEFEKLKSEMALLETEIIKNQNANIIQRDYEKLKKDEIDQKELSIKVSDLNENRLKTESEQTAATIEFNEFKKEFNVKMVEYNTKLSKIDELLKFEADEKRLELEQEKLQTLIGSNEESILKEETKLSEINEKIEDIEKEITAIDEFIKVNKPDVELGYALEQTKNIESELIIIDEFHNIVESLFDQTNEELKIAQEEYNSYISQEKKLTDKIDKIQKSIENAFEFEEVDKTNFNKLRSCDKQLDMMKNIKVRAGLIDEHISSLKLDRDNRVHTISVLNNQLIEEQNKLTDIEKKLAEKEKHLKIKREERESFLGANLFSITSNQMKIGDTCPVCTNRIFQKTYDEIYDINPISREILIEDDEIRQMRFARDKIFTNFITLKARCEFEKAQIQIDESEIEQIEQSKTTMYKEFVDANENTEETFEKLYSLLFSTTDSLENLIDLQDALRDEKLNIIINKTRAGTKITIYNSYIENFSDILYKLKTKKAEREFAIYNVNERFKNLREYKRQIAEGKNIELEIESKKDKKYELKDESMKYIVVKSNLEKRISELRSDNNLLKEKLSNSKMQSDKVKESILLNGVPDGVTVTQEHTKTLNLINDLKNTYSTKETRLESCKELLARTENEYKINTSILANKKAEIESLSTKISNFMIESEFKSDEELESYFENPAVLKGKQNKLSDYNNNYKFVKSQIEELSSKDYSVVNENVIEELKIEVEDLSELVKELSEKVGRTSAEFERIEQDNKKRKEINADLKVFKHKFDLAKELSTVLKGKALAEYVAEEYLQEITTLANQKLNILLDGKYVLKFINKDFVVEDNFNDGIIRSAGTLSGGETFLVSLSLAL